MTTAIGSKSGKTRGNVRGKVRNKVRVFMELGKLRVVEMWLGAPLAWSLWDRDFAFSGRGLALLVLAVVTAIGISAAALALDDVTGATDGLDENNHGGGHRAAVRKPLLDGTISLREARVFAGVCATVGLAALVTAVLIAPHRPWWMIALTLGGVFLALNYSYFLKLSYVGGGEVVTLVATALVMLFPYGLATGELTLVVVAQALLIGVWELQTATYANCLDRVGDARFGRLTWPARLPWKGIARMHIGLYAVATVLLVLAVVGTERAWLLGLLALPLLVTQVQQARKGLGERDFGSARALGFRVFRFGFGALMVNNLAMMAVG
ncbi:UbiA family prenyltransferase [Streptomyces apocyni]|uniref:UbiA family prenyltransferase n=1 Tax=Streptomyces apocyni TaxID=2654677 RepID=UPI0018D0A2CC|nr:UbiA family prenyltransferase [Streptomyces apocyni]